MKTKTFIFVTIILALIVASGLYLLREIVVSLLLYLFNIDL